MRYKILLLPLALLLIWPFASLPASGQDDTALPELPFYEVADCQFDVPAGESVTCGYLTVPEDRTADDPSEKTIRLHVARFRSHIPNPPDDPIIYLIGGPGVSLLYDLDLLFFHFAAYLQNRDVIILDQRGTGFSEPALECREVERPNQPYEVYLRRCRRYLENELDINLSAYNSVENAADVADLRMVLEVESWNIVGVSYGSRLASYIMRDHPEGVRSVILDSVAPLHLQRLPETQQAVSNLQLQQLLGDCLADYRCARAYPNLLESYAEARNQVDDNTLVFSDFIINNAIALDNQLYALMQRTDDAMKIPAIIDTIARRDINRLEILMQRSPSYNVFEGMFRAMNCNDGDGVILGEVCAIWNIERESPPPPVQSDIPALVLNGTYDTATPPSWADSTADALGPAAYFYVIPYTGHGVVRSGGPCPEQMALDFLDNPASPPDSTCIAEMQPDFYLLRFPL